MKQDYHSITKFTTEIPQPKVSIITICLNSEKFLEQTIKSVCEQTYKNIEYIVIDGNSSDGTLEIIKRYKNYIDYWVSEPDKGISDAFNKGVLASTGDIIGFLNSQDYYYNSNVIKKIVDVFIDNPSAKIVYGKTYYITEESCEIVGVTGKIFTEEKMRKSNIMPHQSVFTKREVFERFGLFRLDYKFAMDYEHLLRATKSYSPIFLDEGIAVMRLGGKSDANRFAVCTELFKAQIANKSPFLSSLIALFHNYLKSIGLKLLRLFNIYTLWHLLYKKMGVIR